MKYLLNKTFQRGLKNSHLDADYVSEVLNDIFKGRATPLGSKIYKIRAAKVGQGKRGGFRNIFFWKRDELIVFCLLFGKNEQDDLADDEMKALRVWSGVYDQLTGDEIDALLENNTLKEVRYDK